MDAILLEWGGMLLRWVHIITAIAWIGSSFYFMHIDAALKPLPRVRNAADGELWEVHGGGFYHVQKYLVAPEQLPKELIWHKWESYSSWITGFFLLIWIYYVSAEVYLIDPAVQKISVGFAAFIGISSLALGWVVYDALCKSPIARNDVALAATGFAFIMFMAWFFQQVFSARGAFIHTGALMATMMTGNVAMVIIPNQRKVVEALLKGEPPDPKYGKIGKQRSTHNNYLTLPVIFLMISNHYPLSYSSPYAYIVVGLVLVSGALIRHFYNERHAGRGNPWWAWPVAAVAIMTAIWISLPQTAAGRAHLGLGELPEAAAATPGEATAPERVVEIVTGRCSMCHAHAPVWQGIHIAPKGVRLDTPEQVQRWKQEIIVQAGMTRAMPPNNLTEISEDERRVLREWGASKSASLQH